MSSGRNEDVQPEAPTTSETDGGELASSAVPRRGDRRLIINTKDQLKKFMTDHLNVSLESLNIDW